MAHQKNAASSADPTGTITRILSMPAGVGKSTLIYDAVVAGEVSQSEADVVLSEIVSRVRRAALRKAKQENWSPVLVEVDLLTTAAPFNID